MHTKSVSWWSEVLATARETDPIVYRKLCKEVRVNFYRERVATASTPAEWGKILRWRSGHSDDQLTVMVVNGRVISDTERVASYLATQAFRPAGAQEGSRPAWPGPRLPPEWAARLADRPSDDELKDAFLGAISNTPGPDWTFKQATVVTRSKPGRDPRSYKGWRPITAVNFRQTCGEASGPKDDSGGAKLGAAPQTLQEPSHRSALDLVQALVHDAETMSRQGYHGLRVTLDVDSAYPSVQPPIHREVLTDQGWPYWLCKATADFCQNHRFSFRWAQSTFRSDTGLLQGSPWSPILFVLYSLLIITPSQQESSFMWLGVSLDPKLSPAKQAAARASATTAVVGLIKRLFNTRVRGFPPAAGPNIFNVVVTPSLLLFRTPYRCWSRLHQAAFGLRARIQWEPKRAGIRAWLGLPYSPPKKRRVPPPDMHRWWQANRHPSARWSGHSAKPFLEEFYRQCPSRWLAEASGHGDFLEYHTRFNHSQEAIRECPRGGVVSRSHFFSCPLTSFNNPLAGRLDPRAFWSSFQPFKSRASQVKLQGQAQDAPTGHPICNDPDRPPEMGSMVARLLD
ncbi:uncharacterized protein CTHT_0074300 [Thermochaetoides thermophila DSM 1495]|uniref:Uncharacterized protein n=1 Tax=Chaetomium thermophilum (strain DSM 1495 / CBS 144.50 / IMI 039719) TaxID=759272 RepID=G0SI31_CHATD|nr:hypothetical protein CTHT_0074300 [Thermochaetoides thermophila DSM 1495]EGS17101.1 hypothetical protein CTHT_0074300 [Thermochaetoides thermophila DSM 1495]